MKFFKENTIKNFLETREKKLNSKREKKKEEKGVVLEKPLFTHLISPPQSERSFPLLKETENKRSESAIQTRSDRESLAGRQESSSDLLHQRP